MKSPRTLTHDEERRLLKAAAEHTRGFRDYVIMLLALKTGLREHEILALNVGDVFDQDGNVRQAILLTTYKGDECGINAENQMVWITNETLRPKLKALLKAKKQAGQGVFPLSPLFVSREGNRLSSRQLRQAFTNWQMVAGFDRKSDRFFRFHDLRHTACTNYYARTDGDIKAVQRFARHASITTTAIYTHVSDDYMAKMTEKL